uniref:Cleavage and polyadenylation specificity factor subunit 2 n=2 Tax=Palpitomonas bilix TaxID=652834 RepID=A0A7S3G321_9EUKA
MSVKEVEEVEEIEKKRLEGTERREEEERRARRKEAEKREKRRKLAEEEKTAAEQSAEEGEKEVEDDADVGVFQADGGHTAAERAMADNILDNAADAIVDEYGEYFELVDEAETRPGQATLAVSAGVVGGGVRSRVEEEAEELFKAIVRRISLPFRCSLRFFDFEGRSDLDSQRTIIAQWEPKRVYLLRSPRDWSLALASTLPESIVAEVGKEKEAWDIEVDSAVIPLRIEEEVLAASAMVSFKDVDLQRVVGVLRKEGGESGEVEEEGTKEKKEGKEEEEGKEKEDNKNTHRWVLSAPTPSHIQAGREGEAEKRDKVRRSLSTFVGNVRISEILQRLREANVYVSLSSGVVQCRGMEEKEEGEKGEEGAMKVEGEEEGGKRKSGEGSKDGDVMVTVRKTTEDSLSIEGGLCRTYFKVREVLYNYLHSV